MPYKIYVLKDPIFNEIRYVGCTNNSLKRRLQQHITHSHSDSPDCREKKDWIKSLIECNTQPDIIAIATSKTKKDAEEFEKFWIIKYLKKGCDLLNVCHSKNEIFFPKSVSDIDLSELINHKKLKSLFEAATSLKMQNNKDASEELGLQNSQLSNILNGHNTNTKSYDNYVRLILSYTRNTFKERFGVELKANDFI